MTPLESERALADSGRSGCCRASSKGYRGKSGTKRPPTALFRSNTVILRGLSNFPASLRSCLAEKAPAGPAPTTGYIPLVFEDSMTYQ